MTKKKITYTAIGLKKDLTDIINSNLLPVQKVRFISDRLALFRLAKKRINESKKDKKEIIINFDKKPSIFTKEEIVDLIKFCITEIKKL